MKSQKIVIYQVLTRLFGNTRKVNKPWGTIEENGVGKFHHFTHQALQQIKELGVSHIWYTGVLHHALIRDYRAFGISNDHPDVVKGRAGSPYAIKDYYNVNPDLAEDPNKRLREFQSLIERTHAHGLKVIIDIVPNHVARSYKGITNPPGVEDFGARDDSSVVYHRNNNFYYNPGESFKAPTPPDGHCHLGSDVHGTDNRYYQEEPAKWTGNGTRSSQPRFDDWYETVKINFGVAPDGTRDFDSLPEDYYHLGPAAHYDFWKDKQVPDSWKKFRDIGDYWLDQGIDGFRYDMAELVPVEFWSYLNAFLKTRNPQLTLIAEVYDPNRYHEYIHLGKMDCLYDKVEFYDTLKQILQGQGNLDSLSHLLESRKDIQHHLMHFLENHDEQRLASPEFAGDAKWGKPGMVVAALTNSAPVMIYFGQEVGEPAAEDAGFGKPSRTSIFDYVGVPNHQKWVNHLKFDGGQLNDEEKQLRDFYQRLLNFSLTSEAIADEYADLHLYNQKTNVNYQQGLFFFARWSQRQRVLVVVNFDPEIARACELQVPNTIISTWKLPHGDYKLSECLYGKVHTELQVRSDRGTVYIQAGPLQSLILELALNG